MPNDSMPELELRNVRTRERIVDTVARIRQKSDVPARTRLALAKTRQRWHRDPTPLVAVAMTAAAGLAAIVVGTRIRNHPAGRLGALREPAPVPVFKPVKVGKDGKSTGVPVFARKDPTGNPVFQERQAAAKRRKKDAARAKKSIKQMTKAMKG
ncbi:hypothetical protein [Curtobacterium herbarum]|uniref:hypothetical protein n=1 Tax=Curtobacterium herbarum TaxID=150122 RepID=UPI001C8E2426|nr:hypothetical protein [Curtobacterium herbarum]MBY0176318.1 hypothetical protein [Curtobacterium herbarum]